VLANPLQAPLVVNFAPTRIRKIPNNLNGILSFATSSVNIKEF